MSLAAQDQHCQDSHPTDGLPVRTACGGIVRYSSEIPCALYQEEPVYFCLSICKADFEADPRFSCLAGRISEKNQP